MENVVRAYLEVFAKKNRFEFIEQATAPRIFEKWGFKVPVDKSTRKFDFAISDSNKLVLMEVNFYGGGGSKLKATAGEYKGLNRILNDAGHMFVWVTDGQGWATTIRPLREAFNEIDYLWNLKMLNSGCLSELFD
jgi:type II restriction enzyme